MASFIQSRGYSSNLVQRAQERVSAIPRDAIISERSGVTCAQATIPPVLTYHPLNAVLKNIMTRNLHLLRDDPDTGDIYQPLRVLCTYRRDNNVLGVKSFKQHNCFCRRSWHVSMRSVPVQYLRPHHCFTYDQYSRGTYHHQFQVHLYKLQRGIPYQMSYLQQGLNRRDKKKPRRSIQRALTFNTTNQHRSPRRSTFCIIRTRLY